MTQKQAARVEDSFRSWLIVVHDPRVGGRCRHPLLDILVITFCAILCGASSFVEIEDFGKAKEDWFRTFLGLPNGIPSHDTFRRVVGLIDPKEMETVLRSWATQFLSEGGFKRPRQISLDGKSLKGTERGFNRGKLPLHLINVYCPEEGLVLGQNQAKGAGTSEISAAQECLRLLDIRNVLVTVDAAGSYPVLLRSIREKKGHYLTPIKNNQQELHSALENVFAQVPDSGESPKVLDHVELTEKNRGREETRICSVASSRQLKDGRLRDWYPDLQSVIRVIRERQARDPRYVLQVTGNDGKQTYENNPNRDRLRTKREVTYYISDKRLGAYSFLERIRSHWKIENNLHWSLDVAFGEDECRVKARKAARNLSALRKIAFNAAKSETTPTGLKRKLKRAGWDTDYLETLLRQLQF